MAKEERFQCVCCSRIYAQAGRYDLPRCPRCGCYSSLFPEWLRAKRA